ncbi:MAG: diguanylate cyclase [Desulfovibrionaceae bacterium]
MNRVLIVEDSSFFANIVSRRLTENGDYQVDRTTSFAEARAYLKEKGEGLFAALLDLHLPDSSRGEVVDHFVAHGVPSIVFTGEFSEAVRDMIMSKSVVDYVLKENTESLDYLLAALERLQRNRDIKVLVVDDSASTRNIVASLLRTHQYQVLEASSGEAALMVLERNKDTRLVLTDYTMTGMDGFELVRAIRANHPRDRLAVIGMSAESSPMMSARFIKSGANDFLRKPFLVEEFHCRIQQNVEILQLIDTIRDLAEKDPLTGLHNRRHFFGKARSLYTEAMERGSPLTAAILDLDHFKRVNDEYGHDAGDEVLKATAHILRRRFGKQGLVARYGGEEFCLLLPGMDGKQTAKSLELFRKELEQARITTAEGTVSITLSAGFSSNTEASVEAMLKRADEHLYEAKRTGRNRIAGS